MNIGIAPKVDSGNQRRVQCEKNNFKKKFKDSVIYKSPLAERNLIRNVRITLTFQDCRRVPNLVLETFTMLRNKNSEGE